MVFNNVYSNTAWTVQFLSRRPYQYDPDMSASSVHPTLSMTHGIGNVGQVHNGESYINKSLEMIKTIDK